jgi:hypothetical protein
MQLSSFCCIKVNLDNGPRHTKDHGIQLSDFWNCGLGCV